MTGRLARALLLLVGLAACRGTDHERLGDRAYVDENFRAALAEYRLALSAGDGPRLRAKAAQAALRAGDLEAAAAEFDALVRVDHGSVTLAADGLERVAREAVTQGNRPGLQAALAGLQEIAAGRAIGAFAMELAGSLGDAPRTSEALEILPYAAVAARTAEQEDSIMFVYGRVMRRLGRCEPAVPVFESILRRGRLPGLTAEAREHASLCALRVAQTRLERGLPDEAEAWFERVIAVSSSEANRRTAYLGLGDVRVAKGDYEGAVAAYERARDGLFFSDPLYGVVQQRLNRMFDAGTRFRQDTQ